MAISLSDLDCSPPDDEDSNEESPRDGSAHEQIEHVVSGDGIPRPPSFAYSDNYLNDVMFGVIVDVEGSRFIRQAEVGATRTMIERTEERFGLKPERQVGHAAYGASPMLNWLVEEKGIAPHIPVFDKSKRDDDLQAQRLSI
jgi:hypothetical protein